MLTIGLSILKPNMRRFARWALRGEGPLPRRRPLSNEQDNRASYGSDFSKRFLFPWERGVLGRDSDEPSTLTTLQKVYWAVFSVALATLVGKKAHEKLIVEPRDAAKAEHQKESAVDAMAARKALDAESFLQNDRLEGLSPEEIEQRARARGGDSGDPFEGMSPEEIVEYQRQQQQQQE